MPLDPLLAKTVLFRGLNEASRRALARVGRPVALRKREVLFTEGGRGESVFVLETGRVQLVKTAADGRRVVVKTIAPGETFAEVVLFEQERYPVTAIAVKASIAYRIDRDAFRRCLEDAAFRDDLLRVLMERLRYLADRILYLTAYDVEERFFRFLESEYGRKPLYALSMARKDIAAAAGTTPETLSRLLKRLRREGKIALAGRALRVKPGVWERLG
jgi:CRP/FNR family transcriptional regulator